jgi:hypothetical protein
LDSEDVRPSWLVAVLVHGLNSGLNLGSRLPKTMFY